MQMIRTIFVILLLSISSLTIAAEFDILNSQEPIILPANEAFIFEALIEKSQNIIKLKWLIAPNHYLYKDKIQVLDADNQTLVEQNKLPAAEVFIDTNGDEYLVYKNTLEFSIPIKNGQLNNSILVNYQGCAQNGFCFSPIHKQLYIDHNYQIQIQDASINSFSELPISKSERLADGIKNRNIVLTVILFFFFGILLTFTPCVLPMIPLVVNLIIGERPISSHRALILSGVYVAGMAGTYAVAGTIAGILGETLQTWLQQAYVIYSVAALLVFLALTQFEVVHFKMPHINKHLHIVSGMQSSNSLIGAFLLGIIASLIVSPCITPPLIGALTYIWQDGSPIIGGITLLFLGLGMGVPLIGVALLSSTILPAVGSWMTLIKSLAGIALLALAIWIVDRIVSANTTLLLSGALCMISAVFLKAFDRLQNPKRIHQILKGIGIMLAIYGALLIFGAANNKFKIIAQPTPAVTISVGKWQKIGSVNALQAYIDQSRLDYKPILLFFTADWCITCKQIEREIFTNPEINLALKNFILLKVDLTTPGTEYQALMNKTEVFGPPTILFYNRNGLELKSSRITGNTSVSEILETATNI